MTVLQQTHKNMALIRVRKKTTGQTGTMPEENFNPALYERIGETSVPAPNMDVKTPPFQPSVRILEKPSEPKLDFGDFQTVEPSVMSSIITEPEKEKPQGFFAKIRDLFARKPKEEIVEEPVMDITTQFQEKPKIEVGEYTPITGHTVSEHRQALSKAEGVGNKKAAAHIRKQLAIEEAEYTDYLKRKELAEKDTGEEGDVGKISAKDKALAETGNLRTREAAQMISDDPSVLMKQLVPNQLLSRDFDRAMYDAADVLLRLRTGAQANPSEIRGYMKKIAPSYGDSPEVAQNKLNAMLEDFATYQGKAPEEIERVTIEAAKGVSLPTAGLLPATSAYVQEWPTIIMNSLAGTEENIQDLLAGDFESIAARNEAFKPELARIKKLDQNAKLELGAIIALALLGQAYLPKILSLGKTAAGSKVGQYVGAGWILSKLGILGGGTKIISGE